MKVEHGEDFGGALMAYSWQNLSSSLAEKVADMTEKVAQPFTQSQISMHLNPSYLR